VDDRTASNAAEPPPGAAPSAPDGRRSLAEIVRSVLDGVTQLFRQQVELAKVEVSEAVAVRGKAVGVMAVAGVLAIFVLAYLAAAGTAGLDLVMPAWASRLVVAGVFLVLGAIAFLVGRSMLRTAGGVERTQESVKEDVAWVKQRIAS
jgi:hypothetical protein